MPIFVDMLLAECYIYEKGGQSAAMKDRRERDMVNWGGGNEGVFTSVGREVFLSKKVWKSRFMRSPGAIVIAWS